MIIIVVISESDNGLSHAFFWANNGIDYWRIYASLGLN